MSEQPFDFTRLAAQDARLAEAILGLKFYQAPDLTIAPDGGEYLYRWHMIRRNKECNVYFHIQVASDPERPLHDHPWDNTSVLLAGGYEETIDEFPEVPEAFKLVKSIYTVRRKKGDVIHRPASWAHRLILPAEVPYTMSLFTTGPKIRDWGFWENGEFKPFQEITVETEGHSSWKGK